jgi:hypothetical protein
MSDPLRLRSDDDPEGELGRALLRSGRARAPQAARHRAVIAATSALAATSLSAGGASAGGAIGKLGAAAVLKWLVTTAIVGALAVGAVKLHDRLGAAVAPGPGLVAPLVSAPGRPLEARGRGPALALPIEARPVPSAFPTADLPVPSESALAPSAPMASSIASPTAPAATRPSGHASSSADSVREELATLERASEALDRGHPSLALSILDEYDLRFPRPSMEPEAAMLQIEALFRAGDGSTARRAGEAFLANHPRSPYAARVRSLIGASP